jgi:hypothetical protein
MVDEMVPEHALDTFDDGRLGQVSILNCLLQVVVQQFGRLRRIGTVKMRVGGGR